MPTLFRLLLLLLSVVSVRGFELRLIGVRTLPAATIEGTLVGGLSGIDYDAAHDRWIAISDDKSEHGPARCYALRLEYDANGFGAAEATGVTILRQPDGTTYPSVRELAAHPGDVPDFEALRLDPRDGSIWYASEGDPSRGGDPFVRHATTDGMFAGALPMPDAFSFHRGPRAGPRPNLTFEALAFAPDGASLWLGLEGPLRQDGDVPGARSGALTRLTRFDREGRILAEIAYALDPWQHAPAPNLRADNGLSDLLALPAGRLLGLERSGAEQADGTWHFRARLYEIDPRGAPDVRAVPALLSGSVTPAPKRLVFDFVRAGQPWIDNLEALAWGRRLADGHPSLVVVSDNNFSTRQQTQLWVFEALPEIPAR